MKKLLTMIMAVAMVFTLAIPAFAAEPDIEIEDANGLSRDTAVPVTVELGVPTIKVTVPGEASLVFNPYKADIKDADGAALDDGTSGQIVFETLEIENASEMALELNIKQTKLTPKTGVTLATAPVKATATDKQIFAYLEVVGDDDESEAREEYAKANKNQMALTGSAQDKLGVVGLDATSGKAEVDLYGDMTEKPNTSWTAADAPRLDLKFSFTPVATE